MSSVSCLTLSHEFRLSFNSIPCVLSLEIGSCKRPSCLVSETPLFQPDITPCDSR